MLVKCILLPAKDRRQQSVYTCRSSINKEIIDGELLHFPVPGPLNGSPVLVVLLACCSVGVYACLCVYV